MSVASDYFILQEEYQKKYGDNTVVLIQLGKFYEIYEYDSSRQDQYISNDSTPNLALKMVPRGKESIGHAVEISSILNMKITSKNKSKPHSKSNPQMVGFPCPTYENHRDLILMHGFTIVRVDQKDNGITTTKRSGNNMSRIVVEIANATMEIDNSILVPSAGTNCIVSIYLECQKNTKNHEKNPVVCGLSSIDILTGKCDISEVYSREHDEIYAFHEIYRYLTSQQPSTVLVHINKLKENNTSLLSCTAKDDPQEKTAKQSVAQEQNRDTYVDYVTSILELDKYPTCVIKTNDIPKDFLSISYQEEFLNKVYDSQIHNASRMKIQPSGPINIIDQLDLELFHYGRISFIVLLQHCYEHNETIIKRLQKPTVQWTDQSTHLILTHNAINQLDLLPKQLGRRKRGLIDSLISVIDLTSTSMGSRYLRKQIINPSTDVARLNLLYNMTNDLVSRPDLLTTLHTHLHKVPDIERLQRRTQLGVIRPRDFATLFRGYLSIRDIYVLLVNTCCDSLRSVFMSPEDTNDFNQCCTMVWSMIDFDKLENTNIKMGKMICDESFIHLNCDQEVDQLQNRLKVHRDTLTHILDSLNQVLAGKRGKGIEVIGSEDTIILQTTNHKASILRKNGVDEQLYGRLEFQPKKNKTIITSDLIRDHCDNIIMTKKMLESRLCSIYWQIVGQVATRTYFPALNNFVEMVDFLKTNAQVANKYKYYRPQIDNDAERSYIDVKDLRHPIIEQIIRSEYISNDVSLGQKEYGWLLFGVNSTGKSSLAKALALIIIMAQAGMFTAGKLTFKPYQKIITRLSGNDNLFKGESLFIVEMSELRTILRNADENTLVLGDELCRGTESISGTSLTVATIETLIERKSSFLFLTHMHHLPELDEITKQCRENRMKIKHIYAYYDATLDKLVYDRKLKDGPGTSMYGLEVCKSLAIDSVFIDRANELRRKIEKIPPMIYDTKKSRYNMKVYVDLCSFCGTKINLHTHHIKEQSKADAAGYIGDHHKNREFNLLVLCNKCHENVHSDNVKLIQRQTLNGVYVTGNA